MKDLPAVGLEIFLKQYVLVFKLSAAIGHQRHHPDCTQGTDTGSNEEDRSLSVNRVVECIPNKRKDLRTDSCTCLAHGGGEPKRVTTDRSRERLGRDDEIVVPWTYRQKTLEQTKQDDETGECACAAGSERDHRTW
jgi:hypothetical protein